MCLYAGAQARETAFAQFSPPYDPDFAASAPLSRPTGDRTTSLPAASDSGAGAAGSASEGAAAEAPPAPETSAASAPVERAPDGTIILPPPPSTPLPDALRDSGPFLLLDRADPSRIFEAPASTAAKTRRDFAEFVSGLTPFRAPDQKAWNKMREDVEYGVIPRDEIELPPALPPGYDVAYGTGSPQPPRPEIELPSYGTSLSITGRKLIGFSFSEKRYLRDQRTTGRAATTNLIDITQQLQLRMQGKVGPKITVNVDYDDTKTNKQDISVVYTGDPDEVVQNASFGDIDLSLPATEFVSYNKQLFGIRVNLKYKGFNAIFIGSRTKGQTKTKQFRGNTTFNTLDVPDTSYVRRQYYDLSFGNASRLPLRGGSERVYISRKAVGQQNVNEQTLIVDDLGNSLAAPRSTFTGSFMLLSPGVDYTVDYVKGVLTFRNTLDAQDVVAVDFIDNYGTSITQQSSTDTFNTAGATGRLKLVKTFADVAIVSTATESGYNRELKTFYNLGRSQIVRDDGRGSFFLKVLDLNRNEVGSLLDPAQKYPETINVDFENGIFQLQKPFAVTGDTSTPDPELYSQAPLSKRLFQLEFRFRLKTYFLEPNIVLQSEVVVIDGQRLSRNSDYFIDYESGFITFFNEQRIQETSIIDISYEVAPFAGTATESLLGTRVGYDWGEHFSIGSTLLYQSGSKPPTVPTVNELAKSLLVYEADMQLKSIRLLPFLQGSLGFELAQSQMNPNLSKRAIIENMEGMKQDDLASTQVQAWQVASNPNGVAADPQALDWSTVDVPTLEINPTAPVGKNENQKVLNFHYDFSYGATNSTVSIVSVFSPTGLDFSQKTMLEITMYQGSASKNQINFHLGGIDENADGTGVLKTEDANNDGLLSPNEDIGFDYAPPAKTSKRYGAGNGRIDTEDLNRNGRLDPADFSGDDFGYVNGTSMTATSGAADDINMGVMNFTGWKTFQIPLNVTAANLSRWQAIKQLRISITKSGDPTSVVAGDIRFSRIAVVGNAWQRGIAGDSATGALGGGTVTVKAVNNVDDPTYIPIYKAGGEAQEIFTALYGTVDELQKQTNTSNISEQALELGYQGLVAGTTIYTKRVFNRAFDISQHRAFAFLLYGSARGNGSIDGSKTFFLRAGSDKDYFEVKVPINFSGWKKVVIRQVDSGGQQIADSWQVGDAPSGTVVFSTGNPSLQQIPQITAGVYSTANDASSNAGTLWLDEIHVAEPITRVGTAQKIQADFTVPAWGSFGFKHRFMDRHYQTPTTVVSNQDNRQDNAYLNLDRISFLPLRFALSRIITVTPNANATGNLSNTVSLMSAGRVTVWNGSAQGSFNYGAWPRLNLSHERARTEYELLTRLDDRKTYTGSMDYSLPFERFFTPRTVGLNYTFVKYSVSFDSPLSRSIAGNFNTDEFTNTYGARLTFVPWSGSSLNPNYSMTQVKENRSDFTSGAEVSQSYPKSQNQNVGFSSNFRLLSWLNPSVAYSVNTLENNILSPTRIENGTLVMTSYTVAGATNSFPIGEFKTVNRSANGSINLTLNASEILTKSKLLRSFSLTNGYSLQDGDVYNNIEKGLDTKTALWVRTPLRPRGAAAQRANQTLRDTLNSTQRWTPLEAYDLEGRKAALKTFAITNNYVKSIQRTDTTGTLSKTVSTTLPDLIASLSQMEKLVFADSWMRNGQINLKYAAHTTENVGQSLDGDDAVGTDLRAMIRERFDTSLSFNRRTSARKDLRIGQITQTTSHQDFTLQSTFDVRIFRFTPKLDYQEDVTTLGTGVDTQNTTIITPSMLIRTDISLPKGLRLPFSKKTLSFTNRVIWTTTLSLAMRKSPVTIAENSKLFNLNTNADYELAKNLRMTLNGAVSRMWHKYIKEEDYVSYQFGTMLTFQF
ncbi:MAG: hypothetical protein WC969_14700 [Elusimicrobiota bacterium]